MVFFLRLDEEVSVTVVTVELANPDILLCVTIVVVALLSFKLLAAAGVERRRRYLLVDGNCGNSCPDQLLLLDHN